MAAHGRLKNEFTEDEKCYNLMRWLNYASKMQSGTVWSGSYCLSWLVCSKTEDDYVKYAYEPQHDKPNKMSVRPAKTQISLGIYPVWSESSLCTQWIAKDPRFLHADNEDSDQTGWMPRLIWVFAGHTLILLVLSCCGSYGLTCFALYLLESGQVGVKTDPFIWAWSEKPSGSTLSAGMIRPKKRRVFQVSQPYLCFCPDLKHFIVKCEQNIVKYLLKYWILKWKMQFLYKIFW